MKIVEVEIESETRPFSVACDWCATPMTAQIRREQAGRMFVVQMLHADGHGRPCRGPGRGIPTWPLRVELREVAGVYELRIGSGLALACSSPGILEAKLQELGVDRDEARRQIPAVEPGQAYSFDVVERRRQWRERGSGPGRDTR